MIKTNLRKGTLKKKKFSPTPNPNHVLRDCNYLTSLVCDNCESLFLHIYAKICISSSKLSTVILCRCLYVYLFWCGLSVGKQPVRKTFLTEFVAFCAHSLFPLSVPPSLYVSTSISIGTPTQDFIS